MRAAVFLIAGCATATSPPANRSNQVEATASFAVCPVAAIPAFAWTHELFPGCPAKPLEYSFAVCGSAPCPRPCRRKLSVSGSADAVETYRYDALGRWIATQRPGDSELYESCEYRGAALSTCRRGDPIEFERDRAGRIVVVRDAAMKNNETRVKYDARGDLVEIYDTFHDDWNGFEYDATHRLLRERSKMGNLGDPTVEPVVTSHAYRYDARGRLATVEARWADDDPDPRVTRLSYDERDRLVAVDLGNGRITFAYDAHGRLIGDDRRSKDQHVTVRYEYDCR